MVKLDTLQEVAMRAKLQVLLQQHRDLDTAIFSLEQTGTGDQLQLRRLKKMKLELKDKIQVIENMLIPDIIA
ncbi:YdcH family protein [Aestuariivirga sp.]|uniref:YdcH family protein n=1 Tax=Aestuariivirga sp. TaxID=2650926 RepID=UPI0039E5DE87